MDRRRVGRPGVPRQRTGGSIAGAVIPDPTTALDPLVNAVIGALFDHKREAIKAYAPTTLDVSQKGSWHTGHAYVTRQDGMPFTDAERWQRVEYMKTL